MRNRTSWLLQFRLEPIDLRPSPAALFLALFWHPSLRLCDRGHERLRPAARRNCENYFVDSYGLRGDLRGRLFCYDVVSLLGVGIGAKLHVAAWLPRIDSEAVVNRRDRNFVF